MKALDPTITLPVAGASVLAGTVFGLPIAALFAGFWGGITLLSLTPPLLSWWARVTSLTASTATAGFVGPYAAALGHVDGISHSVELFAFSFILGFGAQFILPKIISAAGNRIDQIGGGNGGAKP